MGSNFGCPGRLGRYTSYVLICRASSQIDAKRTPYPGLSDVSNLLIGLRRETRSVHSEVNIIVRAFVNVVLISINQGNPGVSGVFLLRPFDLDCSLLAWYRSPRVAHSM